MAQPESNYFKRKSLLNRPFNWQSLRKFGSSRMVKSSYYWIFLIPAIVKVANHFQPVVLNLFGTPQLVDFTLPFSWYLLYFSALSFAFANLLYDIFCPKIISSFKDFREFIDSGHESLFLSDEFERNVPADIVHDSPIYEAFRLACNKESIDERPFNTTPSNAVWIGLRKINIQNLGGFFYALTQVVNYSHPTIMKVTGCFYYLGFLFLFIILYQNISFVLIEMINSKFFIAFNF